MNFSFGIYVISPHPEEIKKPLPEVKKRYTRLPSSHLPETDSQNGYPYLPELAP